MAGRCAMAGALSGLWVPVVALGVALACGSEPAADTRAGDVAVAGDTPAAADGALAPGSDAATADLLLGDATPDALSDLAAGDARMPSSPCTGLLKPGMQSHGGAGDEQAHAVATAPDGALVVGGSTAPKGSGKTDAWLVRQPALGPPVADVTHGGAGDDAIQALALRQDGSVIGAGWTRAPGSGDVQATVAAWSAGGQALWSQTLGGPQPDAARAVAVVGGSVIAVGYTGLPADGALWTLQGDGAIVQQLQAGGAGDDALHALALASDNQTADGKILAACGHRSVPGHGFDAWFLPLSATFAPAGDGTTLGGAKLEVCVALAPAGADAFWLAGWTSGGGAPGDTDVWYARVGQGTPFTANVAAPGLGQALAAAAVPGGGAVLAGFVEPGPGGGRDGWAARIDASGNLLWQLTLGDAGTDALHGVARAGDVAVLAGRTVGDNGSADAWLVRLTPWGGLSCKPDDACATKSWSGCDDGQTCTTDHCKAAGGCFHTPIAGCAP